MGITECISFTNFLNDISLNLMIDHQPCTTTSGLKFVENLLLRGSISPGAKNPFSQKEKKKPETKVVHYYRGKQWQLFNYIWSVWLHCVVRASCSSAFLPYTLGHCLNV